MNLLTKPPPDVFQYHCCQKSRMSWTEKVDASTEWCSPTVVVPKPNGKVRICRDFIQLNKAVLRENHPMPTTEQTLGKLAGAKVISKLLTTFITPWGRYCYTHLPFGISSAPEHFQKSMQRILEDLPVSNVRWTTSSCMGRNKQNTTKGLKLS